MRAALVYATLSPYHVSRLETSGIVGREQRNQLVGIEIADSQRDYQWPHIPEPGNYYSRLTLFPRCDYWTLSYRRLRSALYQALDDLQPQVVFLPGWGFKESLAGLGWCLRRRIPRVVISDSQPIDTPQTLAKLWLKRSLVQQFQAGFVGGKPHLRYLADLGLPEERCCVGCDVVNNGFFAQKSQQWREQQKRNRGTTLLSCLRFLPRKNILAVLDVLASQAKEWTWTIAGDGPQRPEIERRIKALGLQSRVRLSGYIDYFRLPSLYAQADVYLQPSLSEPWGLAVNEAMACGLPVVVSKRCGCHEDLVRQDVNGFTFDPTKPESLADTLGGLLVRKHRWHEMGQASQEIIAHWGLDLFAQNFWRACEMALRPRPEGWGSCAISKAMAFIL